MQNFDVYVDGQFLGRVASEDLRKLQRKMPFKGVSFIETVKGLDCAVEARKSLDFEPVQLGLSISSPRVK